MRCFGRTQTLKRCGNRGKWPFCHHHRFQPLAAFAFLLSLVAAFATIYQVILQPQPPDVGEPAAQSAPSQPAFQPPPPDVPPVPAKELTKSPRQGTSPSSEPQSPDPSAEPILDSQDDEEYAEVTIQLPISRANQDVLIKINEIYSIPATAGPDAKVRIRVMDSGQLGETPEISIHLSTGEKLTRRLEYDGLGGGGIYLDLSAETLQKNQGQPSASVEEQATTGLSATNSSELSFGQPPIGQLPTSLNTLQKNHLTLWACRYLQNKLTLALISVSDKTSPTKASNFQHELAVRLVESQSRNSVTIPSGSLVVKRLSDITHDNSKETLFRFSIVLDVRIARDQNLDYIETSIRRFLDEIPKSFQGQIIPFDRDLIVGSFIEDTNALIKDLYIFRLIESNGDHPNSGYDPDLMDKVKSRTFSSLLRLPWHDTHCENCPALNITIAIIYIPNYTSAALKSQIENLFEKYKESQASIFLIGIGYSADLEGINEIRRENSIYLGLESVYGVERLLKEVARKLQETYIVHIPYPAPEIDNVEIFRNNDNNEAIQSIALPEPCIPR